MSAARVALVIGVTLMLQVTLIARFSYLGARPDVMVLLAIMAGYILGPERGAIVGFASGMAFDVLLSTPLGLSALTYTIIGYAVGVSTAGAVRSTWWMPSAVAAVGSVAFVALYVVLGAVVGEATLEGPPLTAIVVYVAAINAVFAPAASRALAWTRRDQHQPRHHFISR